MFLSDFQIKEFAERLKIIAKKDFGGVGKLAERLGTENLSFYTQNNPREPKATFLYKLASLNIDINYLLTGSPIKSLAEEIFGRSKVAEQNIQYASMDERLKKVENELIKLKSENHDQKELLTLLLQENISLEARNKILLVLNIQMDSLRKGMSEDTG